jgi:HAD superfamily hydrolase (TIGR01509 family)
MIDTMAQNLLRLLNGKKLLIFDFDGTIADTSHLHAAAFKRVLSPLGLVIHYPSIAGMKTADAVMHCAATCNRVLASAELNDLVAAKQKLVREMMRTQVLPMPGVDCFLRWAQCKYRLSMATSGSRGTVGIALESLGYGEWFDPLVCAEDVERAKPYPDAFQRVLHLTGCSSDEALIFEDSEAGLMAAVAARVDCIHIQAESWNTIMEELS